LTVNTLKNLDVFITGNNLINQKYEINYGYPMPGTYYNLGLDLRF
jgi:iron complex outermembrane receptor protein